MGSLDPQPRKMTRGRCPSRVLARETVGKETAVGAPEWNNKRYKQVG